MRTLWTWTYGATASPGEREIRIEGGALIASDTQAQPSPRTFTLAEAFRESRMLFIDRPEILAEVLRALAALLEEGDLERPLDRRRRAFWRHLAADGAAPLKLAWSWPRLTGKAPQEVEIEVAPVCVRGPEPPPEAFSARPWQMLDEALFHGPIEPGVPPRARAALVDRILSALAPGSGLGPGDAFPEIDHARIPAMSWSWNRQEDGEEGASIGGPSVVVGYQFGHDMGWTGYSAERVLTGAPDVYISAPGEIRGALLDQLRSACRGGSGGRDERRSWRACPP